MRVFVTGSRGVPNIPGGIETHCQNLYPLLVKEGAEVLVVRRKAYAPEIINEWNGINLTDIYAPKIKGLEAIIHTFLSLFHAILYKPDIVHIHGIGPALLTPIAKLLRLKVVITHHGSDYERANWGLLAKSILKLGEKLGCYFADECIAISKPIQNTIMTRSGSQSHLIFNGVNIRHKTNTKDYINRLGLELDNYIIAVARFVPEKGLHDLIEAYNLSATDHKLVIAGDADFKTDYSENLKSLAAKNPNIILTGYITGEKLHEVYSHASLFVLPSYHEGLPISLLEALSYGLKPLVSDIPANKQVPLEEECFFRVGDVNDLKYKLLTLINSTCKDESQKYVQLVKDNYNWSYIAKKTMNVYQKVIKF